VIAPFRGVRRNAGSPALMVGVLAVALTLAMKSPLFAVAAAVAFAYVILLGLWGFAQAGTAMVTVAYFMAPLDSIRPIPGLHIVSASDVLWGVGFLTLAPILVRRPFALPMAFLAPLLAFVAVAILASVGNPHPLTAFQQLLRLTLGALGLPILIGWWRPDEKVVVRLASAYVLGSTLSSAVGIAQYHGERIEGLTTHPNFFAMCCTLAIAIMPFLETRMERGWRLVILATVPINVLGIWLSGSRTGLLGIVFVALLYPLLKRSVMAAVGFAGLGITAMYLVVTFASTAGDQSNALGRLLGGGTASVSDNVRIANQERAWHNFQSSPVIGRGFEPRTQGLGFDAHDIYLQVASATGVLGLTAFVLMLAFFAKQATVTTRHLGLLAVPVLVYMFVGPIIPMLWDRWIWCMAALALLVPEYAEYDDEDVGTHIEAAAVQGR
jgi:O-antigen ligase